MAIINRPSPSASAPADGGKTPITKDPSESSGVTILKPAPDAPTGLPASTDAPADGTAPQPLTTLTPSLLFPSSTNASPIRSSPAASPTAQVVMPGTIVVAPGPGGGEKDDQDDEGDETVVEESPVMSRPAESPKPTIASVDIGETDEVTPSNTPNITETLLKPPSPIVLATETPPSAVILGSKNPASSVRPTPGSAKKPVWESPVIFGKELPSPSVASSNSAPPTAKPSVLLNPIVKPSPAVVVTPSGQASGVEESSPSSSSDVGSTHVPGFPPKLKDGPQISEASVLESPAGKGLANNGYSCTSFGSTGVEQFSKADPSLISGDVGVYKVLKADFPNLPFRFLSHTYGRSWSYSFAVDGRYIYDVVLEFAEVYDVICYSDSKTGLRVFTASVGSQTVQINVKATVGCGKPLQKTFNNIEATEGIINLSFKGLKQKSMLSSMCYRRTRPIVKVLEPSKLVNSTTEQPSTSVTTSPVSPTPMEQNPDHLVMLHSTYEDSGGEIPVPSLTVVSSNFSQTSKISPDPSLVISPSPTPVPSSSPSPRPTRTPRASLIISPSLPTTSTLGAVEKPPVKGILATLPPQAAVGEGGVSVPPVLNDKQENDDIVILGGLPSASPSPILATIITGAGSPAQTTIAPTQVVDGSTGSSTGDTSSVLEPLNTAIPPGNPTILVTPAVASPSSKDFIVGPLDGVPVQSASLSPPVAPSEQGTPVGLEIIEPLFPIPSVAAQNPSTTTPGSGSDSGSITTPVISNGVSPVPGTLSSSSSSPSGEDTPDVQVQGGGVGSPVPDIDVPGGVDTFSSDITPSAVPSPLNIPDIAQSSGLGTLSNSSPSPSRATSVVGAGGIIEESSSIAPSPDTNLSPFDILSIGDQVEEVPTNDSVIQLTEDPSTLSPLETGTPSIITGEWRTVIGTKPTGSGFSIAMGLIGALLVFLLLLSLFFAIFGGGGGTYSYSSQYSAHRPGYDPSQGGYTEDLGPSAAATEDYGSASPYTNGTQSGYADGDTYESGPGPDSGYGFDMQGEGVSGTRNSAYDNSGPNTFGDYEPPSIGQGREPEARVDMEPHYQAAAPTSVAYDTTQATSSRFEKSQIKTMEYDKSQEGYPPYGESPDGNTYGQSQVESTLYKKPQEEYTNDYSGYHDEDQEREYNNFRSGDPGVSSGRTRSHLPHSSFNEHHSIAHPMSISSELGGKEERHPGLVAAGLTGYGSVEDGHDQSVPQIPQSSVPNVKALQHKAQQPQRIPSMSSTSLAGPSPYESGYLIQVPESDASYLNENDPKMNRNNTEQDGKYTEEKTIQYEGAANSLRERNEELFTTWKHQPQQVGVF